MAWKSVRPRPTCECLDKTAGEEMSVETCADCGRPVKSPYHIERRVYGKRKLVTLCPACYEDEYRRQRSDEVREYEERQFG